MTSALERLQQRHKAMAAAKVASPDTLPKGTPAKLNGTVGVLTESCVGKNIDLAQLLNKTKDNTSKVDAVLAKVKEHEDAGLYTAPKGLDGLDGANSEEIMRQLRELDHALIAKTPDLKLLSIKIRKDLEQYSELTHILTDAQLGIICSGVLSLANVATEPKTKAAKSAAATRDIKDLSTSVSTSMI